MDCVVRDEFNTDIAVNQDITTKEKVAEIVQIYVQHVKSLTPHQIMHVHVDGGITIPFEQMFQVYLGVKHVHTTFKIVDEVNVYLVDSITVRCFRALLNLISPTVRVKVIIVGAR